MKNNWNPEKIRIKELERRMKNNDIAVPTYQRGVVWNDKMQKELIDSIKKGFPFGTLIMYDYQTEGKPMLLIDGLQRSIALFKFVNNPSDYFEESDISNNIMDNLSVALGFEEASDSIKNDLKKKIIQWVKTLRSEKELLSVDVYRCANFLASTFKSASKDPNDYIFIKDIKEIIDPIFNGYIDIYNKIIDKEIPYIEITGDPDCLSTIFFRINDKGIKLSKENKFAATWANRSIKITNEKLYDFVTIVAERYASIQSDGTSIFGYNHQQFIDKKELDIFELCHAFGKYIKREYPELFGKITDKNKTEAIGFTLLNACLLGYKETLPNMNKLLFERFNDDSEINTFIVKVLSCIKYVDTLLAPYIKFKSNKRIGGKPLHTDFQIVSIVATIFRMKHVTEIGKNEYIFNLSETTQEWRKYDLLLKKNMIKKYISDAANNTWSGHGDNILDNIIHNSNFDYYTRDISKEDLKSTLDNWFKIYKANNKEQTEKEIKSPSNTDKLILNIIYSEQFSARMQLNEDKFDIEHIFPKKLAEKMLVPYKGELKLPLSSIGNICLLPESTNRKKKEKTIYDDVDYTNKLGRNITIQELEDNYTFTKKEQLSWIYNKNMSKEQFEEEYNKYIDARFDIILKKVIEVIYSKEI